MKEEAFLSSSHRLSGSHGSKTCGPLRCWDHVDYQSYPEQCSLGYLSLEEIRTQTPSTGLRHPFGGRCRKVMLGVWSKHCLCVLRLLPWFLRFCFLCFPGAGSISFIAKPMKVIKSPRWNKIRQVTSKTRCSCHISHSVWRGVGKT